MSNGGFTFRIRTQFSFVVNDQTLSAILSGIAKQGINITGYLQTKPVKTEEHHSHYSGSDLNTVRLVAGSPESESGNDLLGVRKVLDCLDVKFQEKSVIQVVDVPPGMPGVISSIFGALWCKVTVYAIYLGEVEAIFIDVSDIGEALMILSWTPLQQCPKQGRTPTGKREEKNKPHLKDILSRATENSVQV